MPEQEVAGRIMVVDDEKTIRETLSEVLADEGYHVFACANGREALEEIHREDYDVVICDIRMPGMDGTEVLERISEISPQSFVIMITAYATLETAIQSLRKGAYDYIIKPLAFDDILTRIDHLIKYKKQILEARLIREIIEKQWDFQNIIGKSKAIAHLFEMIEKISVVRANVLITGESGTGKELVARAIHFNGPYKDGSFVPINCGAIPETLLESELFGHVKGAFTGATADKVGMFMVAHQGTLFLDEIGEVPGPIQVKLLRAIESKEIYPLGSTKPIKVDARIIAATNKDLVREITRGAFREDLYYRLNVLEISIPPLRERKEDIPILVRHFIQKFNKELKKSIKGVDNLAMKALLNSRWKGNVRELENVIERATILGDSEFITLDDLPLMFRPQIEELTGEYNLKEAMKIYEREHITNVLKKTGNDKKETSRLLGLSLASLYRKIEELGIKKAGPDS